MLEKDSRYSFSRLFLAIIAAMSLLTAFLTMLKIENGMFFAAFIPAEVAMQSVYKLDVFYNDAVFFVLCFGLILMYYVCYVLARKNKTWLLVGFLLYLIDTACMIHYIVYAGINSSWIIELAIHAAVLIILLYGFFRACKLEKIERQKAAEEKYIMEFTVSDD